MEASMATGPSTPDQASLDALRLRRAELRQSMSALELAMAEPAPIGRARWAGRVHVALVELSADFREHLEVTQGEAGLHSDVLAAAPRLSGAVGRLAREHVQISHLVDDLLARTSGPEPSVDLIRRLGTTLLGLLVSHRQRGSDLLYEAYEFDVGGET
jgi:hypothetical protein